MDEHDRSEEIQEVAVNKKVLICSQRKEENPVNDFKHKVWEGMELGDNVVHNTRHETQL